MRVVESGGPGRFNAELLCEEFAAQLRSVAVYTGVDGSWAAVDVAEVDGQRAREIMLAHVPGQVSVRQQAVQRRAAALARLKIAAQTDSKIADLLEVLGL